MASAGSIWGDILGGLKRFFTSPITSEVVNAGGVIVESIWPGLTPLVTGVLASIAKAEALAAAAGAQTGSGVQKLAFATQDANAIFLAYQQASGKTYETATQQAFISDLVTALEKLN